MMMHGNSRSGERGPMAAMRKGERARNFKATMGKLVSYLREYQSRIIIVGIFAIASTVFNIVGPKVLGNATTSLFEGVMAEIAGTGSIDFAYIGRILGIMLVLYVLSSIFAYMMGWIMAGVSTDIAYRFRQEIAEIEAGRLPRDNHPLKHAPHTIETIAQSDWPHPYSRETAAFPAPWLRQHKFWPSVSRIDNVYGDRNLICTCPPMDTYSS